MKVDFPPSHWLNLRDVPLFFSPKSPTTKNYPFCWEDLYFQELRISAQQWRGPPSNHRFSHQPLNCPGYGCFEHQTFAEAGGLNGCRGTNSPNPGDEISERSNGFFKVKTRLWSIGEWDVGRFFCCCLRIFLRVASIIRLFFFNHSKFQVILGIKTVLRLCKLNIWII